MNQLIQFLTNYTSTCLVSFSLFQACFRWFYSCIWYANLVAVLMLPSSICYFFYFGHGTNTLNSFHSVCQTLWISNTMHFFIVFDKHCEFLHSLLFEENKFPFLFFALYYSNFFPLKKNNWKSCMVWISFQNLNFVHFTHFN